MGCGVQTGAHQRPDARMGNARLCRILHATNFRRTGTLLHPPFAQRDGQQTIWILPARYIPLPFHCRTIHPDRRHTRQLLGLEQRIHFQPRASLALIPAFNEKFTLRVAAGVYYQAPFYKEFRDTTQVDGIATVSLNRDIRSQRSPALRGRWRL